MSETSDHPSGRASFDDGRYLYCLVGLDGEDRRTNQFARGVDGGRPYLVSEERVGAVVQHCECQFDSDRPETVKEWLLQHQTVVDEAGQVFGTPLPFRFDTVLTGDDNKVRDWLAEESSTLLNALNELEGLWEYRIELVWNLERQNDEVEDNERLAAIREQRDNTSAGKAHLLQKEYERRQARLAERRRQDVICNLQERLAELVQEVHSVDRSRAPALTDRQSGSDEARHMTAILASTQHEANIGEYLDTITSKPGLAVRFTGPWPPYSFAPTIGQDQ